MIRKIKKRQMTREKKRKVIRIIRKHDASLAKHERVERMTKDAAPCSACAKPCSRSSRTIRTTERSYPKALVKRGVPDVA